MNNSQNAEQIFFSNEEKQNKELLLLFRISTMLDQSIRLDEVIHPILNTLAEEMNILSGAITLLNRSTGEIQTEASYGLSHEEKSRGRYKLGEGITGSVVATGKPQYIQNIANEPQFLDKTGALQKIPDKVASFICVPIKIGVTCIGTLSVFEYFIDDPSMQKHMHFFTIIASLISQGVKLRQKVLEEHDWLIQENNRLQSELKTRHRLANIIGDSNVMQGVFDQIAEACLNDKPLLVRGESGTGKETVATAIHYNSKRTNLPHIKMSCIAVPEEIIEEELFGLEDTQESKALHKPSKIEQCQSGTLLLVEVADLPMHTQQKLLHFLQEKTFEQGGNQKTIRSYTRITATSSKNLEALVKQGRFNTELLKKLNEHSIYMPPLRERKSDIPHLINYFIKNYASRHHKQLLRISTAAINMLMNYHWPGNVSELESCIEHAIFLTEDKVIHPHHLPPTLQTAENTDTLTKESLPEAVNKLEKSMILDTLTICRGSLQRSAKILQVTERVLGLRIKKHKINVDAFK